MKGLSRWKHQGRCEKNCTSKQARAWKAGAGGGEPEHPCVHCVFRGDVGNDNGVIHLGSRFVGICALFGEQL